MIDINNIHDVCRGGVECGEGYVNIISCEEGIELINLLKSYQKDVEIYKNLYKAALKEAKQQYEWRMEDSECGDCEIKEGLDMLEYRIKNSINKENEDE